MMKSMQKMLVLAMVFTLAASAMCWDLPWNSGNSTPNVSDWEKWNYEFTETFFQCCSADKPSNKLEKLVKKAPKSTDEQDLFFWYCRLVDGMMTAWVDNGGKKPFIWDYIKLYEKAKPSCNKFSEQVSGQWIHNFEVATYVFFKYEDKLERSRKVLNFYAGNLPELDKTALKKSMDRFVKEYSGCNQESFKYVKGIYQELLSRTRKIWKVTYTTDYRIDDPEWAENGADKKFEDTRTYWLFTILSFERTHYLSDEAIPELQKQIKKAVGYNGSSANVKITGRYSGWVDFDE